MSLKAFWFVLGAAILAAVPSRSSAQSDPFAPTASQPPEVVDQIWQKAVSKYDPERAKILQQVD